MAYIEGEFNPVGNNPTVVYPAMGGGNGFGGGYGYGNDLIWIILLFALWGNNGWGNNNGSRGGSNCGCGCNGNMLYDINQNTNRGFDNLALNSGIDGVQTALTNGFASVANGFANAEVSRCNAQTNLLQTLSNNQFGLLNAMNANNNALNSTITNGFFDVAMANQKCCCDNRLASCQTQNIIQNEGNATRFADANNTRDIITNATANTQAILDKLCQLELDGVKAQVEAKNDRIAELQQQLINANLAASQTAQTAQLLSDNARQTAALEQYLNPAPIPAYVVQNPNCCARNNGCGCGCNGLNVQ